MQLIQNPLNFGSYRFKSDIRYQFMVLFDNESVLMCVSKFKTMTHIDLQRDGMDSKSVVLRKISVRVGLGVILSED